MDLLLANLLTIVFFVVGHRVIGKAISYKAYTPIEIVSYSSFIFCSLAMAATLFAFLIGLTLPEIYPITFSYKALFICPFISIYFSYKMRRNKR